MLCELYVNKAVFKKNVKTILSSDYKTGGVSDLTCSLWSANHC